MIIRSLLKFESFKKLSIKIPYLAMYSFLFSLILNYGAALTCLIKDLAEKHVRKRRCRSFRKSKIPAVCCGAAIYRRSAEDRTVGVAAFIFAAEWLLGRGGVTSMRMRARGQPHKQRSFGCYVVCLRAAHRRVRQQPPHVLEVFPAKIGIDNRVTDFRRFKVSFFRIYDFPEKSRVEESWTS